MKDILIILIYIISLSGISFIFAKAFIFESIKYRFLKHIRRYKNLEMYMVEFLYCPMCIGVWIGIFGELYSGILNDLYGEIGYVMAPGLVSIFALFINKLLIPVED